VSEKLDENLNIFDLLDILDLKHPWIERCVVEAILLHYSENVIYTSQLILFGAFPRLMEIYENTFDEDLIYNLLNIFKNLYTVEYVNIFKKYMHLIIGRSNCKRVMTYLGVREFLTRVVETNYENLKEIYNIFGNFITLEEYRNNSYFVNLYFYFLLRYDIKLVENNIDILVDYCLETFNKNPGSPKIIYELTLVDKLDKKLITVVINKIFENNLLNNTEKILLLYNFSLKYNYTNYIVDKFISVYPDFNVNLDWIFNQESSVKIIVFLSLILYKREICIEFYENIRYIEKMVQFSLKSDGIDYIYNIFIRLCSNLSYRGIILNELLKYCYNKNILKIIMKVIGNMKCDIDSNFIRDMIQSALYSKKNYLYVSNIFLLVNKHNKKLVEMLCYGDFFISFANLSLQYNDEDNLVKFLKEIRNQDNFEANIILKAKLLLCDNEHISKYIDIFYNFI
jgi:hypothetical protein